MPKFIYESKFKNSSLKEESAQKVGQRIISFLRSVSAEEPTNPFMAVRMYQDGVTIVGNVDTDIIPDLQNKIRSLENKLHDVADNYRVYQSGNPDAAMEADRQLRAFLAEDVIQWKLRK